MEKTTFLARDYISEDESFHFARKPLAKRFPERAHDHDFFEVFLIEQGRTAHWVNGTHQMLEAGQLVFMRPGDVHAFCADRALGCRIINVIFRPRTASHLRERYADTVAGRFFDADGPLPDRHSLGPERFARAVAAAERLQTAERTLARVEEFLLALFNQVADAQVGAGAAGPSWFAEACSATLSPEVFRKGGAGLVEAAGRSHEHVCRICRQVTGATPSEYVNRIRIDHAAKLLRGTEMTIEEIVEDSGFENLSYFYRLFRQQLDDTPRSYRRQFQRDPFQGGSLARA